MPFDADAWRAAREPWSYTEGGRHWVARPVSALALADALQGLQDLSAAEQADRWRRVFRLAFPWRISYWWLGDPVTRIMALEPGAYQATIADFVVHLGAPLPSNALATSGTSSPT